MELKSKKITLNLNFIQQRKAKVGSYRRVLLMRDGHWIVDL